MTEQPYGPDNRHGRSFGERSLLGDKNDKFFDKPIEEQVNEIAWSEGCPVKDKVVGRSGPKEARNRYGEVIFTYQIILAEAEEHNPVLASLLKQRLQRKVDEPVGEHEPTSVPSSHLTEISAPNTVWGWALPRILIEQFGKRGERTQARMIKGLQMLESAVKKATTPLDLMAILSESIVKANPPITDSILKQTFSKGYLGEENTAEIYKDLLRQIKSHSPILYKRFNELSSEEKAQKGVAEL